jgi:hypothetical protein
MAKKKDNFVIIRSETLELNFYAVRSKDGKWLRAKGYGGSGKSWVDEMSKAKIYANPGPAKAQITFWAKNYPEYGVPELVQITTATCNFIDQEDRVKEAITKQEIEEHRRKLRRLETEIAYIESKKVASSDRLKLLKEEIKKLEIK